MSQCLKCGKKPGERAVFCDECLADMALYPVRPGTVVHLPRRQPTPVKKSEDFEETSLAEQLAYQRKLIRWLTGIITALSLLLVITAALLLHSLDEVKPLPTIGKNYTTNTSALQP